MSNSRVSVVPRNAVRLMVAGFAAALLGGCSSDVTRFSDPYSNPFSTSAADTSPTGSLTSAAPVSSVQSQPLAPPRPGAPIYNTPPARTSALPPRPAPSVAAGPLPGSNNGWSVAGGTPIVVAQGETVAVISQRYGIPASALLHSNGFTAGSQVSPGTRLIIPTYRAQGSRVAEQPEAVRPTRRAKAEDDAQPTKAERIAAAKAVLAEAELDKAKKAKAERLPAAKTDRAERLASTKSHGKTITADAGRSVETPKPGKAAVAPMKVAALPKTTAAAQAKPAPAAPAGTDTMPTASLPTAPAEPAKPEFRWPARGRVIQGFKPGGNDGINIAVPEGTSVKAAEAGVVAYAGSELKGYGNMVLIRHPNGFVSAYANNGELDVKRGDQVKRGQIIAKSGQSGNVSAPQLHFELRKGSTPVDPTGYLAGL
jgi:murein DD-endopeptidase MepM/ murein hydrolase activator NlpD